jgi:hypothetical protein
MSDLTHEEYLDLLTQKSITPTVKKNVPHQPLLQALQLPESVDWRNQSDVGPVLVRRREKREGRREEGGERRE